MSPFAESARSHGYEYAMGGKPDDITVIVAQVHLASHAAKWKKQQGNSNDENS